MQGQDRRSFLAGLGAASLLAACAGDSCVSMRARTPKLAAAIMASIFPTAPASTASGLMSARVVEEAAPFIAAALC